VRSRSGDNTQKPPGYNTQKPLVRSILPILLQPRDRFIDEEGVWEVINHPWSTRGGKLIHATVQKPGEPNTTHDKKWGAHERLIIRRT
jgi:hypothetical protein